MKDVAGKVAFITGGASGMGLGMARAFGAAGMKVMIGDIEKGPMDAAVAELKLKGIDAAGVVSDVADRDSVFAAADATIEAFGKVHVLCNNAGIGVSGKSDKCSVENWRWVMDVNLWGVIYGLQAFVPLIESHGEGGHVMSTASMAGMVSFRYMGPYNATKFAVVTIMETMMEEHRDDNIGVSVLCPGVVATNIASGTRNRQEQYGGQREARDLDANAEMLGKGLDPDIVGEQVLEAIIDDAPYIFTDPSMRKYINKRFERLSAGYDWADNCQALKKDKRAS
ncbi:MAG: SDR family NAD(P)-dependent oxidoreductase [Porticoccaceae bacterium]|nr:SDR family NAD(P)-dependent oxidoreductase [Porticoccaceae bacterium]